MGEAAKGMSDQPSPATIRYWERPFLGAQPFQKQVWCCGRTDEAAILSRVVGWAVGCYEEVECSREIADLKRRGLIATRWHRAPAGEWAAYRLTPDGFDRLAEIGYGDMHDSAVAAHRFYAGRGSL